MFGFLHILRFQQDKHLFKFGFQQDYECADGRDYQPPGLPLQPERHLGHPLLDLLSRPARQRAAALLPTVVR